VGTALTRLIELLDLEAIEENIFRGQNEATRYGRLFGGQVAAQALAAAGRTVEERRAHSLHAYFLRGGDPSVPIVFTVDRIRDGTSFTTRRVVAVQHGRAIFNMSVSFHKEEESYDHQDEMPDAPDPDTLPTWEERVREAGERIPEHMRSWVFAERAIDTRSTEPHSWFATRPSRGPNPMWLRASGRLGDDPLLHQCLLAYASDMGLVDNIYRPHRGEVRDVMMASLDHAMWFHRDFRLDEWLLYVQQSPTASGARGFALGTLWSRDGRMVCTVAQEGLMRRVDPARLAEAHAARPPKRD
jgi:acyl-CoA thioesterase-2